MNEIWGILQMPIAQEIAQEILPWVVIALVIVWIALRVVEGGRLLAFNNPTGRVLVSRGAIKGLIARTCNNVEGVAHPQSRIATSGGKLRVRLYIQLRGPTRLTDVSVLLQEKLDMALRQNLGIEKIGRIDVVVTDIQPASKKASSSNTAKVGYPWEERYGE
jgi:uncharacterized alkaline shock family protein YloU